ncbi:YqhG family protein [Salinithrix halophila]|uniref:YqhG family protein n=1 Tax=Salinithrix halophila TaxID=1485204 RepID=A0ABV8JI96_9BACL
MEPSQVRSLTLRYLKSHDCEIIEDHPDYMESRLSVEADKDLIHRPFYWMYVEKMGFEPQPSTLLFTFKPGKAPPGVRSEHLTCGSPRFNQMLHSARKNGRFIRLYEDSFRGARKADSRPYDPWLAVNYEVSSICDRKKDELLSLGIHLRTGEIIQEFHQRIQNKQWTPRLPDRRHTLPPLLTVPEAVGELEFWLQGWIEHQDLSWAVQAKKRLEEELAQLHAYYPEEWRMNDELHTEKKQRLRETVWQYHPRVEVEVVNAGLFYLDSDT